MNVAAWKVDGDWKSLWNLHLPHHVKMLLWRACRDCLPTRSRLQTIVIHCPLTCVMCNTKPENASHVLLTCNDTRTCWMELGCWEMIEEMILQPESFSQFFFDVCGSMEQGRFEVFLYGVVEYLEAEK